VMAALAAIAPVAVNAQATAVAACRRRTCMNNSLVGRTRAVLPTAITKISGDSVA
jgi:hypothetical protein